jgi:hypothetical protein
MEWDKRENAEKFLQNPALAETMKTAGVTSAPERHFLTRS